MCRLLSTISLTLALVKMGLCVVETRRRDLLQPTPDHQITRNLNKSDFWQHLWRRLNGYDGLIGASPINSSFGHIMIIMQIVKDPEIGWSTYPSRLDHGVCVCVDFFRRYMGFHSEMFQKSFVVRSWEWKCEGGSPFMMISFPSP